jgi:hypothetical protein
MLDPLARARAHVDQGKWSEALRDAWAAEPLARSDANVAAQLVDVATVILERIDGQGRERCAELIKHAQRYLLGSSARSCRHCGAALRRDARFCGACGTAVPVGEEGGSPPLAPPALVVPQKTNGLAVASLVLGILWIFWIGSVLAIVIGSIARRQIDASQGRETGRELATAGVVLGWVGVAILLVLVIIGVSHL